MKIEIHPQAVLDLMASMIDFGCKTAKMLRNQLAKLLKYLAANPTYQVKSYAHDEELVEHVKNLKARL